MNAIRAGCHHAMRMNEGTTVFTMKWQQLCGVQNRLFWACSQPSKVVHACWGARHKMGLVLAYIWREA
eukprot:scaffold32390_cov67-Phaeocystis_antarctica.AAC.2